MKVKHLLNTSLPLSQQTYDELRNALKLGKLKWISLSKELQDAYHYFEEMKRKVDFEKQLHNKGTESEFDYETPI